MRKANGFILALLCLLLAAPAMAALDLSHHDLPNYNTASTQKDKCFYCHGLKDVNSGAAIAVDFGTVGGFCVARCHSGGSVAGAGGGIIPQAPASVSTANAVVRPLASTEAIKFTQAHGDNTLKQINGSAVASSVGSSGFPYTTTGTNKLECTSCHAVHDATNTPFLWSALSAGAGVDGFCDKCHASRATNKLAAGTNPNGMHPVDFAVNYANALARADAVGGGGPARNKRTISLDWSAAANGTTTGIFDVVTANGTGLNGAQNTGIYQTGGHLGNFAKYSGAATDVMGCYTCHSAHQPGISGANNLTVLPLLEPGANTGFNPLCTGCHGSAGTWANNMNDNSVGGNSPAYYGHPYGSLTTATIWVPAGVSTYTVSVGGFTFTLPTATIEAANTQNGIQFGTNGALLCSSCHDVHDGVANTKSLANLGQGTGSICNACHDGSELADVQDSAEGGSGEAANAHHRTTKTAITAAAYKPTNDLNTLNINLAWVTPGFYNEGSLADGLQCADCHQFNGTAHNW